MSMPLRSYLFVPATRIDRIAKATTSGAGAVIVDLEDAVAPQDKVMARESFKKWLQTDVALPVYVRINGAETSWYSDDCKLCTASRILGVVVPKAEETVQLSLLHQKLPGKALLPLIETAVGFHQVLSLAKARGVERLLFGSIDFKKDLGISGDGDALLYFRSHLVLVSRLARLQSPVDGVTTAIDDMTLVSEEALRASTLGFGGKLCIHPKQIAAVEKAFLPSAKEQEWAKRVLHAAAQSQGAAVALDGQMIDKPVIERAQSLLARASS
jgi:citrate lyase subunit beta / citryl-CoA lyase